MGLLQYSASLPRGSGRCFSRNALPHRPGAVGSGTPTMPCLTAWGSGQWDSCNTVPHCLRAMGSEYPAIHCLIAWGRWAVKLLQSTASLPRGCGQWNFCNSLAHYLGAVGSGTPAIHCLAAWAQWAVQSLAMHCHNGRERLAVEVLQYSGQCNSCNTLPHCLGAVGCGTRAMQYLSAWGR